MIKLIKHNIGEHELEEVDALHFKLNCETEIFERVDLFDSHDKEVKDYFSRTTAKLGWQEFFDLANYNCDLSENDLSNLNSQMFQIFKKYPESKNYSLSYLFEKFPQAKDYFKEIHNLGTSIDAYWKFNQYKLKGKSKVKLILLHNYARNNGLLHHSKYEVEQMYLNSIAEN